MSPIEHDGQCESYLEQGPRLPVRPCKCAARAVVREHSAKVQFLVDFMEARGLLEEGCFTFPDGDTWWATGREPG